MNEYRAVMDDTDRGNWRTRRKEPASVPICPSQIPH